MINDTIRVGIVGLGGNTRLRHVPGLRACENVEIVAVSNRRRESTDAAAREFGIPKKFDRWQDLVADADVDAVVIGAWPYLHAPITLAALAAGKHVLTEARMAMNATEARQMLAASREHPNLVCQIVPSPFGLRFHRRVKQMIDSGYLGDLREVVVVATSDALADASTPLAWRQVRELSGLNALTLGIFHETLIRWTPDAVRVMAQANAFTLDRRDPTTGSLARVGTPDSVQVMTILEGGARGLYHASGVTRFGPGSQIHLYGGQGTIRYEILPRDRLMAARVGDKELAEVRIPPEEETHWRVEQEFIDAIRGQGTIEFTDFATGVRYMEFTEAVARSAATGVAVDVPGVD